MNEVIQRLEMVKNAIMLEDEDIIDLQVMKLSKLTLDSNAQHILSQLQNESFETVIALIDSYRQSKMGLISYEDKEVYGLRLELKKLEVEYEDLALEKINLESLLGDFNNKYYHSCGDLIESILLYRAQIQQRRSTEAPEDKEKAEAYEEAQHDYEEFHKDNAEKTEDSPFELSLDEQRVLKTAYRKASRLCHPDKVSDEFKEQAAETFKQLSEAYKSKNLKAVKEILESLESQKVFSVFSDTVSNAEKLRRRISELRKKIASIAVSIRTIKEDETYQLIEAVDDWDSYFSDMKDNLSLELDRLRDIVENPDS